MVLEDGDDNIRRLYKYRPDNEHTLDILRNNELYFSFVEEFNDPFDCRVSVVLPTNKEQWETHVMEHHIDENLAGPVIKWLELINFDTEKIMQQYEKSNFHTITLYCLSEIRDNILMWSHYANSHCGICIGFETMIDQNSLCIKTDDVTLNNHINPIYHRTLPADKVKYQSKRPEPYDFLFSDHHHLYKFFNTKSIDWQYEKERRITMPYRDISKRMIRYEKSALKEVIFGCKASDEFKQQVMKLIKDEYSSKNYNVDILQCSIDRYEYHLNINELK
jgi:hypothetical protein